MARLFGALANAGAQYNKGRFAREQYDAEQQRIARDEARRAFEFGVMNDRAMEQMRETARAREEQRIQSALNQGFEEDLDTGAIRGAGVALDAVTGFQGGAATARAPEQRPYEANVEGIPIRAPKMGSQYMTIGGRTLRRDRQRDANAGAMEQERKLLEQFAMKRDVQKGLIDQRADRREDLQAIINAGRQPPQRRTQLVQNADGEYVIVDMDQIGPTGLKGAPRAAARPTAAQAADAKLDPMRMALKDVGAQALAKSENGGFRTPNVGESALYSVERTGTPVVSTLAGAARARAVDPATQVQQQLIKEVESMILPLKGGKAITEGERKIISGVFERVPGEPPEMRQAKVAAFERLIATTAAKAGEDPNALVAEMRQRAAQYKQRPSASERLNQMRTRGDAR